MKIVDFAIKRPVTMIIAVAVVLILGIFTWSKLVVDLFPEMKLPIAAVVTTYPGTGPEEVESRVTELVEGAVNTVGGIESLESVSSAGSSMVIASFSWGTDIDNAVIEMREQLSLIEGFLPEGAEAPMVIKMDPNMMPIMQVGLEGGDKITLGQLQAMAEDKIKPRLERIPDVAQVTITGGLEREVKVEVDPVKLQNYGITLSQVNQVLQMENFNYSTGKVSLDQRQYFVRTLQQFESIDDFKQVAIITNSGDIVYLRDIANIVDGYKDDTQLTRIDGQSAVGIHMMKQSGANTTAACKAIKEELSQLEQELGTDYNTKVIMDQSLFIEQSLSSTERTLIEGALLAMLILFIFLRNMRSTLIIFTAIPLSIIATFVLMYFNGSSLNMITLGGLALGLGRMVDDSIVVFENIYRHRKLGLSPANAALTGASEVSGAVIASTLTLIAVFAPMIFVVGLTSIIFKPMALTISFAILCSLVVALTVVPLMSSRMLTDAVMAPSESSGKVITKLNKVGQWLDNLGERYQNTVRWALGHRKTVVIGVTVLMIASLAATPLIGAEFLPKTDSGEISIGIETDKGNKLKNTDALIAQVEDQLRTVPEVETIFSSIGSAANMMSVGSSLDQGAIYVLLVPKSERDRSVDIVAEDIRNKVADIAGAKISVTVSDVTSLAGGGDVNVQIKGDDFQILEELSDQVAAIIRNVPGTREVTASLTDGSPEVQIKVDRQRAAAFGLTPMQVSSEIRNAMQGTVATRYSVEGTEVDVWVGYSPQDHENLSYLQNLPIRNTMGAVVNLSQIATFELAQGPVSINRVDQVRYASITANLLNRDLQSVMQDIQTEVNKLNLPVGYVIEYTGASEEMVESFKSLALALVLAIILVYAVMAVLYESFFNPFVIMFSIPTAFVGIVLGLLVTGRAFSVTAFIGIIMLVGIAVANAIVLVDYLEKLRQRGMERDAAIVEAGRVRLRPILMTALATILAMLPMSTGIGEGAELIAPMATVVIGGLIASTLITLLLVPVVYSIFDDWLQKARRYYLQRGRSNELEVAPVDGEG